MLSVEHINHLLSESVAAEILYHKTKKEQMANLLSFSLLLYVQHLLHSVYLHLDYTTRLGKSQVVEIKKQRHTGIKKHQGNKIYLEV